MRGLSRLGGLGASRRAAPHPPQPVELSATQRVELIADVITNTMVMALCGGVLPDHVVEAAREMNEGRGWELEPGGMGRHHVRLTPEEFEKAVAMARTRVRRPEPDTPPGATGE